MGEPKQKGRDWWERGGLLKTIDWNERGSVSSSLSFSFQNQIKLFLENPVDFWAGQKQTKQEDPNDEPTVYNGFFFFKSQLNISPRKQKMTTTRRNGPIEWRPAQPVSSTPRESLGLIFFNGKTTNLWMFFCFTVSATSFHSFRFSFLNTSPVVSHIVLLDHSIIFLIFQTQ